MMDGWHHYNISTTTPYSDVDDDEIHLHII